MESMNNDWHPIFGYLLKLFDFNGYKCFYNKKKKLVIEITSKIEEYEIIVCLSRRSSVKSIVLPPKIREEREKYKFDFIQGSVVIEKSGWFDSFLDERMYKKYSYGPLSPRISVGGITNKLLDKLMDLIVKSSRMDSCSRKKISGEEARKKDKEIEGMIFEGMRIAENLKK